MKERFPILDHFPCDGTETKAEVDQLIDRRITMLVDTNLLVNLSLKARTEIAEKLMLYFVIPDEWYAREEEKRLRGTIPYYDLDYHNRDHARQATYDGQAITHHVITRNPIVAQDLDLNGVVAINISAPNHDNAYPKPRHPVSSLATNLEKHPSESADNTDELIDYVGLPEGTNKKVVKILTRIGILATYFPVTPPIEAEIQHLMRQLEMHDQLQAEIVRSVVSIADNGQNSRCHQLYLLPGLQKEFDAYQPGKGTREIGLGIKQIADKTEWFVQNILKPIVEQRANWLYGTPDHAFAREWNQLGPKRLLLPNPREHFCVIKNEIIVARAA